MRDLQDFVARGIQLTRCPNTQRLRVSDAGAAVVAMQAAAAAAAAVRSSAGGACGNSNCCQQQHSHGGNDVEGGAEEVDGDAFVSPPSFSFLSSPSEIRASINSINLAESIAKHKQWAVPSPVDSPAATAPSPAAGDAATTAGSAPAQNNSGTDTEGEEALLAQLGAALA